MFDHHKIYKNMKWENLKINFSEGSGKEVKREKIEESSAVLPEESEQEPLTEEEKGKENLSKEEKHSSKIYRRPSTKIYRRSAPKIYPRSPQSKPENNAAQTSPEITEERDKVFKELMDEIYGGEPDPMGDIYPAGREYRNKKK